MRCPTGGMYSVAVLHSSFSSSSLSRIASQPAPYSEREQAVTSLLQVFKPNCVLCFQVSVSQVFDPHLNQQHGFARNTKHCCARVLCVPTCLAPLQRLFHV
eukprot:TRINITY_DN1157_c1_g1_i19.p2 TRINITY_DN1157_c1_g1~~TRINITY_DN1157_c1_g1_i19.p2  ORF type:complete len:101 (-),score=5.57 TRINITY_DN1157_c1_g1_i19:697-999(-)